MTDYSNQELKDELSTWSIASWTEGFGSSYKELYRTDYTTIAAKAFHIPNPDTEKIHHFDLSIRIFKRKKKSEKWIEQTSISENEWGFHQQLEIKDGKGIAVKALAEFLNAQFEQVGKPLKGDKLIIDKPANIDFDKLISNMNIQEKETFGHGIKIQTLKEYRDFLKANLDKNETFIQNWLDENNSIFRKQRCLIFGLEFIDHKREGELAGKRFDILTRTSSNTNEYVIIELKSPCDTIFKTVSQTNKNGGISTEYHLSPQLSRAIPQILHYKSGLEAKSENDDDLQRIGIKPGKISKCIILLGQRIDDDVWLSHYRDLKTNFSNVIEIWTYSDLIDKLDNTIRNLEENLNE